MLPEKLKSSSHQRASHHWWYPGACLRAPDGVQGQRPSGGQEGSSGVLPILNALGELSWAFIYILCIFMLKKDTEYRLIMQVKVQKWQNW